MYFYKYVYCIYYVFSYVGTYELWNNKDQLSNLPWCLIILKKNRKKNTHLL